MVAAIVYALIDLREGQTKGCIFYVGMGAKTRPFMHLRAAGSARGHQNYRVQEVLADHLREGLEPEVLILDECAEYGQAIELEKSYIAKFGRKGIDQNGILLNLLAGAISSKDGILPPMELRGEASTATNNRLWANMEHRAARVLAMRGKPKLMTKRAIAARLENLQKTKTPEAIAKISAKSRERWADPAYTAHMSNARKQAWDNPEKRENMLNGRSEGIAESWRDPEVRAKRVGAVSAAISDKWSNPEYAEAARTALRAAWQDPEKKSARVAKMLATRRLKAEQRKEAGIAPPKSSKRSENMRRINAAKTAEQRTAEQTATWTDPEVRARRLAGMTGAKHSRAQPNESAVEDALLPTDVRHGEHDCAVSP